MCDADFGRTEIVESLGSMEYNSQRLLILDSCNAIELFEEVKQDVSAFFDQENYGDVQTLSEHINDFIRFPDSEEELCETCQDFIKCFH